MPLKSNTTAKDFLVTDDNAQYVASITANYDSEYNWWHAGVSLAVHGEASDEIALRALRSKLRTLLTALDAHLGDG